MKQIGKEQLVKKLVQRLLTVGIASGEDEMMAIDRTTFHQMILYLLMTEVQRTDAECICGQLDVVMLDIQREMEEIQTLLGGG